HERRRRRNPRQHLVRRNDRLPVALVTRECGHARGGRRVHDGPRVSPDVADHGRWMLQQRRQIQEDRKDDERCAEHWTPALHFERRRDREERNPRDEKTRSPSIYAVPRPPRRRQQPERDRREDGSGECDGTRAIAADGAHGGDARDERRGKVQQQSLVRAEEEPPRAVEERMREALARVSRERTAETRDLEVEPERSDRREPDRPLTRHARETIA